MIDDEELAPLVQRAQAGDQDAFARVVELIHYDLRVFVAVRSSSEDLVEEVVQSALITAWRILPKFEARGTFVSWVKGIALNHLRKELSSRARNRQHDGGGLAALLAAEDEAALEHEDPRLDRLRRCLARLGSAVRDLIQLRYRDGLDLDALAERLGKPAGTIAVQFHRLRKSLRTCVDQDGGA